MTTWLNLKTWRRLCSGLITFSALLTPFWAAAAPVSPKPPTTEILVAAFHTSPAPPTYREAFPSRDGQLRGRVAEARHALMELRAFVEEASRTVELGDRLKVRRLENDRLRALLLNNLAAKDALENHMIPTETTVSSLTKAVVQNWLETVRLKSQSDQADRELMASKEAWLALEHRVGALKRTLAERRSKLRTLRAEGATLSIELGRLRQEINKTKSDTLRFELQEQEITAITATLRRNVTSTLRAILLESSDR